jgi:hypothetical protein
VLQVPVKSGWRKQAAPARSRQLKKCGDAPP